MRLAASILLTCDFSILGSALLGAFPSILTGPYLEFSKYTWGVKNSLPHAAGSPAAGGRPGGPARSVAAASQFSMKDNSTSLSNRSWRLHSVASSTRPPGRRPRTSGAPSRIGDLSWQVCSFEQPPRLYFPQNSFRFIPFRILCSSVNLRHPSRQTIRLCLIFVRLFVSLCLYPPRKASSTCPSRQRRCRVR
jgi:hypothetical protein